MTPFYRVAARIISYDPRWQVEDVETSQSEHSPGRELKLHGAVRRLDTDTQPAARLIRRMAVGGVVEIPILFWALLIAWPLASWKKRLILLALGVPASLVLESITTVCQLVGEMAAVSAMLGGDPNPVTLWDRWSDFIEAGGREALTLLFVLACVALVERVCAYGAHEPAPAESLATA
jgi:hypothetical protein